MRVCLTKKNRRENQEIPNSFVAADFISKSRPTKIGILSGVTIRRPSKQGLQVKIDSVRMWSLNNLSNWTDYESHVTFESRPLPPLRLHRLFPSRRTNGSQLPSRFFSPTHPFPHSPFFPGYTICFATQHQPSAFTNTYLILVWGILPLFAPATLL